MYSEQGTQMPSLIPTAFPSWVEPTHLMAGLWVPLLTTTGCHPEKPPRDLGGTAAQPLRQASGKDPECPSCRPEASESRRGRPQPHREARSAGMTTQLHTGEDFLCRTLGS